MVVVATTEDRNTGRGTIEIGIYLEWSVESSRVEGGGKGWLGGSWEEKEERREERRKNGVFKRRKRRRSWVSGRRDGRGGRMADRVGAVNHRPANLLLWLGGNNYCSNFLPSSPCLVWQ